MNNVSIAPLNFEHVLVITYGRSGSTLLQGILNSIDGVLVRGENENVFYDFYESYRKLMDLKEQRSKSVDPTRAWYGICLIDENALLEKFRELAKVILLADRYTEDAHLAYGFKEIRYNEVGDEFDSYLDFLLQLFPNAAFIFNTRNLTDVSASGWWKDDDQASVIQELSTLEARFSSYADKKDHCFSIKYEDVVAKGERLRQLFDFLGADYQPDVISNTLNTLHSYKPEQKHVKRMSRR